MKNSYTLMLQNGQIIVHIKQLKDFDLTVLGASDPVEQLFMEPIRQNPAKASIEYETGDLLSLTDLFAQVHLTKAQACRFLHDLLHVVGTALKNQPVLLDMDAILLSAKADQIYMIRAPLAFECWMKRADDIDEFWKDLLDGLPCDNYEILGLLWKARHEKRSMEEIYHDLEELYQSCLRKKIFGRHQQVPPFKLSKPLIKPLNPPNRTIDHGSIEKKTNSVIEPIFKQTDKSSSSLETGDTYDSTDFPALESGLDFGDDCSSKKAFQHTDRADLYENFGFGHEQEPSFVCDQDFADTGSFGNQSPYTQPQLSGFDAGQEDFYSWTPNPYETSSDLSKSRHIESNSKKQLYSVPQTSYSPPPDQNSKTGSFSYSATQPDFAQEIRDFQNAPQIDGTQPLRRNQFMQAEQNLMQARPIRPVYPDLRKQNYSVSENRKTTRKARQTDWMEWQYYDNVAANYQSEQEQPGFFSPYSLNDQTPNLQDVEIDCSKQNSRRERRYNPQAPSQSANQNVRSNEPPVSYISDDEQIPYSFVQEKQAPYDVMENVPSKPDQFAHIDWKGKKFYLKGKLCMAGRSVECQVHIPDDSLSLQHARLSSDQGRWYIQDMKSCNGTFLNGKRLVRKMRLREGMTVQFGACETTFHEAMRVRS